MIKNIQVIKNQIKLHFLNKLFMVYNNILFILEHPEKANIIKKI